ncbi:prolyl oligopeptidase family serine peptidase [Flavobacterium sp. LS1R47]|uniref:Prolyl oligopeptidase family serine peptidase n=1 Tax=Flavobacterium frigoritolerans TaxID=2987686 RepID=A0A9X2ZN92_9FLAO|nr:prolyl oligopeptidase family serine peptidase [Flavobacterium frigoritolerans]MCV9932872.1 prolyl oligopeptidase family serine peptidase [Flavobacterium frigoritolerans]
MQKKQLTVADYHLWGTVDLDRVSPNEEWASYRMTYNTGRDTLFVRNIRSNKTYHFAGGTHSLFTKDNIFICLKAEELQILNVATGKAETIQNVIEYTYCSETNQLIILIKSAQGTATGKLVVRSPVGEITREITDVTQFSLSPKGHQLVYATFSNNKNMLIWIDLKKINKKKWLKTGSTAPFSDFAWQKEGHALAFVVQSDDGTHNSLCYYMLEKDQLYQLDPETEPNFLDNTTIKTNPFYKILVSDDRQKLFFSITSQTLPSKTKPDSNVEIWNANDKWVYPQQQKNGNFENGEKVALWLPLENRFTAITSIELPSVMLSGDQQYAILSNPKQYEPQFEEEGPRDYYIMNLKTFEKNIFVKKQSSDYPYIIPSPSGKYVAYFKENNWWVYNIAAKTHTNITGTIASEFTAKIRQLVPETACGNPGWSVDDKAILIYDRYDLWAIRPDGSASKRLTHGRESKIRYRIAEVPNERPLKFIYDGLKIESFDITKELLLRAEGEDGKTGYFRWSSNQGEKPIAYTDRYIDQLNYVWQKKKIFFREQKNDGAPQLMEQSAVSKPNSFFQSNPQQKKYFWGKSELVEYQNSKNKNLKGVLLYPANYDPEQKYPMIVHIYEIQSDLLHHYTNPTLYNENGFNPTVFTTQGYFVFFPDIVLENGNPGISATDCVVTATKKVIAKGIVNPDKIGIIGHSFGGYEASFVITQTNLFATAIASGAITDLNSFYLTINQKSGQPEMWRFQSEQWQMGKTPFETPLVYQANSPIAHVQNIKTPVLQWSGKQDKQVDPHQTIEFYLALRRLGKKNITLFYPNESHILTNATNQKDLTIRMQEWFDCFLKDMPPAMWIKEGLK